LTKYSFTVYSFYTIKKILSLGKSLMIERYEIENIEQLRAISDMLRIRILDILMERPMTVTQLGEVLDMAPAKVHYHVRELEKVGLLRLVETREKGGILEKYYQPIAREFSANTILLSAPPDEAVTVTGAWLNQLRDGFLRALRKAIERREKNPRLSTGFARLYITAEEQIQLSRQVAELLRPYENRRGIEGEEEVVAAMIVYPQAESTELQALPGLSTQRTWVVGTVEFQRADLEKAVQEGKRLRINVTGICSFADDISADLAESAIEQFQVIGKLFAPAAVREVLAKKHP
jgi:DNA-binding transcriptional ArsR family regulator